MGWLIVLMVNFLTACQLNTLQSDHKTIGHSTSGLLKSQESPEKPELPQWVLYPPHEAGLIYGVGSSGIYQGNQAKAIQGAKENARVELLKQLHTTVSGEISIETKRIVDAGNTQFSRNLRESLYSRAPETELRGIEVVEAYLSQTQKTAYALVRLDRNQATSDLRRQIGEIDAEFARYSSVPTDIPRAAQLKQLLPALPLMARRNKLEERLRLVSPQSTVATSSQEEILNQRIEQLFGNLKIGLLPSGKDAKALEPGLFRHLTEKGLSISPVAEADLTLTVQFQTRAKLSHGQHFVFADGNVVVKNAAGNTVNAVDARAKGVSGISEAQARANAIQQLGNRLGEALRESLLKKL
jgi:hypothetical protein